MQDIKTSRVFFEDLQGKNSGALGYYSRRLQDYSIFAGVHSSLELIQVLLRASGL
jgi:hypothetical protein